MDTRWPGGAEQGEGAERVFSQIAATVRRKRTLFEPPEGSPPRPDLVPENVWKAAVRDDIVTRGQAIALRHDGADISFNYEVEAMRERLSGVGGPKEMEQVVQPPRVTNAGLVRQRERQAIAEMFRESGMSGVTRWSPPDLDPGRVNGTSFPAVYSWSPPDLTPRTDRNRDGVIDKRDEEGDELSFLDKIVGSTLRTLGVMGQAQTTAPGTGIASTALRVVNQDETARRVDRASTASSVRLMTEASQILGDAFDGKEFWRSVWVYGGAATAHTLNPSTSFDEYRQRAEQNFDRYWEELPRPAQLFVEELNPGNVALVVAGGPLSRTLAASGTRGGRILAGLVEPIASNPLKAVPYEVLASVGARGLYEATEGAPMPVRLGAGLVGAVAVPGFAEAGIRGGRALADDAAQAAIREAEGPLEASALGALRTVDAAPDTLINDAAELNFEIAQLERRRAELASRAEALYADGMASDPQLFSAALRQPDAAELAPFSIDDAANPARGLADEFRSLDTALETINSRIASLREQEQALLGPAVGLLDDSPSSLRAALGDGGISLLPNDREMLDPITQEVIDAARPGTQLNASLWPGRLNLRPTRPAGSKLITVPPVMPVGRPRGASGVIDALTQQTKRSRAGVLNTATERAADMAAQRGGPVPTGIMHNILRGAAAVPDVGPRLVTWFNNASTELPVRQAVMSGRFARNELAARTGVSRAQFIGRVKELFGDTDRLSDAIEYVGPATRAVRGQQVPASEHPLTGTIADFIAHPNYYDGGPPTLAADATAAFREYSLRNEALNSVLRDEYGVDINDFDTGIQAAAPGARGIFFPTYDAGIGRVARGGTGVTPGSRPVGASTRSRTFRTVEERLADASPDDANFEPVTDINEMFSTLDEQKIAAVERETVRYAVGGSLKPVEGWQSVPSLAGNGRDVWLPPNQAGDIERYLTSRSNAFFDTLDNWKKVRLGGDFSLLTIKGVFGAAASPLSTARDMLMAYNTAVRQAAQAGNPADALKTAFFRPFTNEALYLDIAADPDRWTRFFTYFDYSPTGGTPQEWRTGFLERLPFVGSKVQGMNDAVGNVVMRGMEADFNHTAMQNITQRGMPLEQAFAEAAQSVKQGWLESDNVRLGISTGRGAGERAGFISSAFIRQPINIVTDAATGLMKLAAAPTRAFGTKAQWNTLTAQEAESVQRTMRQFGTFFTAAGITALMTAEERGWTPEEALKNALLDVSHPDWLTMWVPFTDGRVKVPLGGPLRGLLRAVAPQPVTWDDKEFTPSVPFGGLANFFTNRVNTVVSSSVQLVMNEDYYGNKIVTEGGIQGIAQALIFAGSQAAPLFLGSGVEGVARQGESVDEALVRSVSEFFGQSPFVESAYQSLERERRIGARDLFNLSAEEKAGLGLTEAQIAASADARTLADLRRAIGTRAANAAAGLVNPEVTMREQGYADDLARRAGMGDQSAEALRVSIDTQTQLSALAQSVTINGIVDGEAYRNQRSDIIIRNIGRSEAYREVFDGFRESDNLIDRYSAEWYDLFDKATTKQIVDGEEVPLNVDYDLFQTLEDEFFARIGPDLASLVEANVATAPRGANAAEVELRQVRRDLDLSGLWDAEEEAWTQVSALYRPKPGEEPKPFVAGRLGEIPADLVMRALDTKSAYAFRETLRPWVHQRMTELLNVDPRTALRFVDDGIEDVPGLRDLLPIAINGKSGSVDDAVGEMKRQWVAENAASGLAERAFQWGYVTEGQYRDGLGIYESDPSAYGAPEKAESKPRETAETESQEVPDLNELLRRGFVDEGLSFGQLGIRHGMTPGAVKQRLKRLAGGGAPSSLRAGTP